VGPSGPCLSDSPIGPLVWLTGGPRNVLVARCSAVGNRPVTRRGDIQADSGSAPTAKTALLNATCCGCIISAVDSRRNSSVPANRDPRHAPYPHGAGLPPGGLRPIRLPVKVHRDATWSAADGCIIAAVDHVDSPGSLPLPFRVIETRAASLPTLGLARVYFCPRPRAVSGRAR